MLSSVTLGSIGFKKYNLTKKYYLSQFRITGDRLAQTSEVLTMNQAFNAVAQTSEVLVRTGYHP
jgi:hypothetical protein